MTIISQLTSAKFLEQVDISWPFAEPADGCILVSCQFNPENLSEKLFLLADLAIANGVIKRQSEFLAGRICAAAAKQQLTGKWQYPEQSPASRAPIWQDSVQGSISHSQNHALCIMAKAPAWQALGIDLEFIMPLARAQRLAAEILTADELSAWQTLPIEQQAAQLTLIFSAKESLFKALHPICQVWFGLHDAQIEINPQGFRCTLLKDLTPQWQKGQQITGLFHLTQEYALTLVRIKR